MKPLFDKHVRNYRIWIHWHGYTKIHVQDGKELNIYAYRQTDEGFSSVGCQYSLEGDYIYCETYVRSRDCDGPGENYYVNRCHVDAIKDRTTDSDTEVYLPQWEMVEHHQRDIYAEAMGY